MKNIAIKLAAVGFLALMPLAPQAFAGHGGSAAAINAAVASGSQDAIIGEIERAENLMCAECVQTVTSLTADSRLEVRQVAAWWFARRPALMNDLASGFLNDLAHGDTTHVRNAADFLGRTRTNSALPQLKAAIGRGDIGVEGRLAIVRAAGFIAHPDGNAVLAAALSDADPGVRAQAVLAWRDMRGQTSAQPIVALLNDGDVHVRAQAAGTVGGLKEATGRAALEQLVIGDPDSTVRRNAAWALGQIGSTASRNALTVASSDQSGLVRNVARASLGLLH